MTIFICIVCAICAVSCTVLCVCKIISMAGDHQKSVCTDEDFPDDEAPPNGLTVNDVNYYDQEEIIPNCTVQILTNTVTGKQSIGWKRNDTWDDFSNTEDDQ